MANRNNCAVFIATLWIFQVLVMDMALAAGPGEGPLTAEEDRQGKAFLATLTGKTLPQLRAMETEVLARIDQGDSKRRVIVNEARTLGVQLGAIKYAIHKLMYRLVDAPGGEGTLAIYFVDRDRINRLLQHIQSNQINPMEIEDFHVIQDQHRYLEGIVSAESVLSSAKDALLDPHVQGKDISDLLAVKYRYENERSQMKIVDRAAFNILIQRVEAFVTSKLAERARG